MAFFPLDIIFWTLKLAFCVFHEIQHQENFITTLQEFLAAALLYNSVSFILSIDLSGNTHFLPPKVSKDHCFRITLNESFASGTTRFYMRTKIYLSLLKYYYIHLNRNYFCVTGSFQYSPWHSWRYEIRRHFKLIICKY